MELSRLFSVAAVIAIACFAVACDSTPSRVVVPPVMVETVPEPPQPEVEPMPARDFEGSNVDLAAAVTAVAASGHEKVLLDGPFGERDRWEMADWANSAQVAVMGDPSTVMISCEPGPRGKWVASMTQEVDLSGYDVLSLDVMADVDGAVALGVWTGEGNVLFESRPMPVQAGKWQTVTALLKSDGFKAASTDWEFGATVKDADQVRSLSLFIYTADPATVHFRNLMAQKTAAP